MTGSIRPRQEVAHDVGQLSEYLLEQITNRGLLFVSSMKSRTQNVRRVSASGITIAHSCAHWLAMLRLFFSLSVSFQRMCYTETPRTLQSNSVSRSRDVVESCDSSGVVATD